MLLTFMAIIISQGNDSSLPRVMSLTPLNKAQYKGGAEIQLIFLSFYLPYLVISVYESSPYDIYNQILVTFLLVL